MASLLAPQMLGFGIRGAEAVGYAVRRYLNNPQENRAILKLEFENGLALCTGIR